MPNGIESAFRANNLHPDVTHVHIGDSYCEFGDVSINTISRHRQNDS